MMSIREAVATDRAAIVAMALRFQATTTYARHLCASAETLAALVGDLLASPDSRIWLAVADDATVGMIAAGLYRQPMSLELIGSEICWWMNPEARRGRTALRLLRTAEAWARERGATTFQMMAPTPEVGAFYAALGFEAIETHYQRRMA